MLKERRVEAIDQITNRFSAMTNLVALYNSLPSLLEAEKKFINRDHILSQLAPLLAAHGNKFGVCLVHRHCRLEEGEMMVATGNVCQPERNVECYPDRWLANGEPYEFTRTPTLSPPEELLKEFQRVVGEMKVVGLFHINGEGEEGVALERTEGRKNIVTMIPSGGASGGKAITTGWRASMDQGMVNVVDCTSCIESGGQHIENTDKLLDLEQRPDLGHNIYW